MDINKNLDSKFEQNCSCLLGAHFSIKKGLDKAFYEAESYKCNAFQIFTKNATSWKESTLSPKKIESFNKAREKTGIHEIASHTSYLINLAAVDEKKHALSCEALKQEMIRANQLKIPYVILHPGSHMGSGEATGISLIASSINKIFSEIANQKSRLLLETTAGQGTSIGHTFEQIASILKRIEYADQIGVCFDTCHVFAAGYDIRTYKSYTETIKKFDGTIGLDRLFVLHLNDSKKDFGSRIDRHEHIGDGAIGTKAFEYIMRDERLKRVPKILETPKDKDGKPYDTVNLNRLRELVI